MFKVKQYVEYFDYFIIIDLLYQLHYSFNNFRAQLFTWKQKKTLPQILWSYSKRFFYLEKYIMSITLSVPIDIPNIYLKITVLHKTNHFTFSDENKQKIMPVLIPQENV